MNRVDTICWSTEHGGTVDYTYRPPPPDATAPFPSPSLAYPSPTATISTPTSPRFPFPSKPLHPINTKLARDVDPQLYSHDDHDVFHSARQTPHHSLPSTPLGGPPSATHLRRAHGLGMTALSGTPSHSHAHSQAASVQHSPTTTWAFPSWKRGGHGHGHGAPAGGVLKRVSSLAELQARLEEAQAEIAESESETGSSMGTEAVGASVASAEGSVVDAERAVDGEALGAKSNGVSSRATSRMSSRAASADHSRQVSPSRVPGASRIVSRIAFHTHAKQLADNTPIPAMQSPYHPTNPWFGYPAYLPPPSTFPSSSSTSTSARPYYAHAPIPQPHHPRRRKRDLARTLSYLAALRFLALHRALQRRARELVASALYVASLRWVWEWRRVARSPELRRVHWAEGVGGREEGRRWGWKKTVGWLLVVLIVLARKPRLRARLAELSRRASRLGVEVAVGRVDGRRARAMAQGAQLAKWAGTKLIRQ